MLNLLVGLRVSGSNAWDSSPLKGMSAQERDREQTDRGLGYNSGDFEVAL